MTDLAPELSVLSISEARTHLPRLIDRVRAGEEITVTRHGEPVAVIVRPDRVRPSRSGPVFEMTQQIHEMLDDARLAASNNERAPSTESDQGISVERAEELVAWIRAGRDAR